MNIQSHAKLAIAKRHMAQAIRAKYYGKEMPDNEKAIVRHLEGMSIEHSRKAAIGQLTFIRK